MRLKAAPAKILLTAALIAGISILHYSTHVGAQGRHVFYQGLYFVPVLLAGFWFGLRGALAASATITLVYLPFTVIHWGHSASEDFTNVQVLVLYNLIAVILGVLRDREKEKQRVLREAEGLAAVGRAASYLANDMKSHIFALSGFIHSLAKQLKSDDQPDTVLGRTIHEVYWLHKTVTEILDFSGPMELKLSPQDIKPVVDESLEFVRKSVAPKSVELHAQLPADLPLFPFDRFRMKQVLINLLLNAVQASPPDDTVMVSAALKGRQIVIDVGDHGKGIPPGDRKEVFLPFYSTKEGAAGLGLAVVRKIVDAHEGSVEILDNPGKGVIARVVLPTRTK